MSLSAWQKMRFRISPKTTLMNCLETDTLSDEAIGYAIKCGLDIDKVHVLYLKNRVFLNYIVENDFRGCENLVSKYFDYIEEDDFREMIIDKLVENGFSLEGRQGVDYHLKENPKIIASTLRKNPEYISKVYEIDDTEPIFSDSGMNDLLEVLDELNIKLEDIPTYAVTRTKDIMKFYLNKDFAENAPKLRAIQDFSNGREVAGAVFESFFENIEANIKNLQTLESLYNPNREQEEKLIEALRQYGYVASIDDYEFLLKNEELMFASLLRNVEKTLDVYKQNEEIEDFTPRKKTLPKMDLTEEQSKLVAERIIEQNYSIDNATPDFIKRNQYIGDALIENDPYVIDEMNISYSKTGIDSLQSSEYIPSLFNTPTSILTNPKYYLECLERDFEGTLALLPYATYIMTNDEEYKRVYEICIQNGYEINDSTPPFIKNNVFFGTETKEEIETRSNEVMEYARQHLEEIDNISFAGVHMSEEFKQEIIQKLLDSNYQVNENTPLFLRANHKFVYEYIMQNGGELNGLSKRDVAPLLQFENWEEHPEYENLSHFFCTVKTRYDKYINRWGKDKTLELVKVLGMNIKHLELNEEYTLEEAKSEVIDKLQDAILINDTEAAEIIKKLASELKKEEIEECFEKRPFLASSTSLFEKLANSNKDLLEYYTGSDEKIYKQMVENGIFEGKSDEEIAEILDKRGAYTFSSEVMSYLIKERYPECIELYKGMNEEVYKIALDLGYIVDAEKLEDYPNFSNISVMLDAAIKQDPYCIGYRIEKMDKDDRINAIKEVIGEESYNRIVVDEKTEKEFIEIFDIVSNGKEGITLLKASNPELIEGLGFESWKTIMKYSVSNPKLKSLIDIADKDNIEEFLKISENVSNLIQDNRALGINKFLNISNYYSNNSDLLKEISQAVEDGYEFSDIEKQNLYILMRKEENHDMTNISLADLANLGEKEREIYQSNLEKAEDTKEIKDDIFKFLFASSYEEIKDIVKKDMNTLTLTTIRNRARKEGNQDLQLRAEYMNIVFEMIERIGYSEANLEDFKFFAHNIYSLDSNTIDSIRGQFGNLKELIRDFYEKEAQNELTNIGEILQDPSKYEILPNGIKMIDLSKSKHTLYGHCLGTSINEFFDRDKGKVTICLSVETDYHEAYYYGEDGGGITIFFDNLPEGAFIGSSIENMGSNGWVKDNDYRMEGIESSFMQRSIRDLYDEKANENSSGHSETLAYRVGLIPCGVAVRGDKPTMKEMEAVKQFERKLKELTGQEIEIPLIKTQHHKNRVYQYQKEASKSREVDGFDEKIKAIEKLREQFCDIISLDNDKSALLRRDEISRQDYTIIDGEIFIIKDTTEMEREIDKLAVELQKIVHGEHSESIMDVRDIVVNNNGKETVKSAIKSQDARSMWTYSRENGALSQKSNSLFLKEFLVDYLLCNYATDNEAFLLDSDEIVYGINKESAFACMEDFINKNGEVYTNMSYLYFDSFNGNNIYRKIFESYIESENPEEVFSKDDFTDFQNKAQMISEMDDKEYMQLFEGVLDNMMSEESRDTAEKLLLARKTALAKESRDFVQRLEEARTLAQAPEKFESFESIAFVNDIHGNLEALKSILNDCKQSGKKDIFILGDMIGFGPQSNECIDFIRENSEGLNIRCILGNHELYSLMGNKSFSDSYGFRAEMTSEIRGQMSVENRRFIESLPISRVIEVAGKSIELTHFPQKSKIKKDSEMFLGHGEFLTNSNSGKEHDYLIYGHEHRTEMTQGDEVGEIWTSLNGDTTYINLPSSGCVHGKKTSYVTMEKNSNGDLVAKVKAIDYEQEKTLEAIEKNKTGNRHFFGMER